MKVTLDKVYVSYKSKAGKPFKTPLVAIYYKTEDGKKDKASGFFAKNSPIVSAQEGDQFDIETEMNGEYKNFKLIGGSEDDTENDLGEKITPKNEDKEDRCNRINQKTNDAVHKLSERIKVLEDSMFEVQGQLAIQDTKKKASDLPF